MKIVDVIAMLIHEWQEQGGTGYPEKFQIRNWIVSEILDFDISTKRHGHSATFRGNPADGVRILHNDVTNNFQIADLWTPESGQVYRSRDRFLQHSRIYLCVWSADNPMDLESIYEVSPRILWERAYNVLEEKPHLQKGHFKIHVSKLSTVGAHKIWSHKQDNLPAA